jgi:hypothetical protein
MPDQHGKLTIEEGQKIAKWFQAHTNSACPSCGASGSWAVAEHLINLAPFTGGTLFIGGTAYPAVMLVCQKCAYFRLYSAVLLGLDIQGDKKEEAKSGGA